MPLALVIVLLIAMACTSAYGWTVERLAYRPLRGSFRLAPLISAIGMSIFLQNYVQLLQGANVKPLPPVITGGFILETGGFPIRIGYIQITIMLLTVILMIAFSYLIGRTRSAAPSACQQDLVMAGLCGVNVDRTISLTFVMGAALAAVAGVMATLYYGVIDFFIGFLAGIKAFTRPCSAASARFPAPCSAASCSGWSRRSGPATSASSTRTSRRSRCWSWS